MSVSGDVRQTWLIRAPANWALLAGVLMRPQGPRPSGPSRLMMTQNSHLRRRRRYILRRRTRYWHWLMSPGLAAACTHVPRRTTAPTVSIHPPSVLLTDAATDDLIHDYTEEFTTELSSAKRHSAPRIDKPLDRRYSFICCQTTLIHIIGLQQAY